MTEPVPSNDETVVLGPGVADAALGVAPTTLPAPAPVDATLPAPSVDAVTLPALTIPDGVVSVSPERLRWFADRTSEALDAIDRLTTELAALRQTPMAIGSGPYAARIVQYYQRILGAEVRPAVGSAVTGLEHIRQAVIGTAEQWEDADRETRESLDRI